MLFLHLMDLLLVEKPAQIRAVPHLEEKLGQLLQGELTTLKLQEELILYQWRLVEQ